MTLRHPGRPGTVAATRVDKTEQVAPGNHLEILRNPLPQHPGYPLAIIPDAVDIAGPDIGNIV